MRDRGARASSGAATWLRTTTATARAGEASATSLLLGDEQGPASSYRRQPCFGSFAGTDSGSAARSPAGAVSLYTLSITGNGRLRELEMLSAVELRRVIDDGMTTVIVPFGSVEHHGGHLPLGTDAVLADLIGREVAVRIDAVLAPTVRVGCAEQHMQLSGTLTLRSETLTEVAVEIGQSLAEHRFRLIALISTHGGNTVPLHLAADRLNETLRGASTCVPEGDVGPQPGRHSGEWLTSVMLAARPDLVDVQRVSEDLADELQTATPERGATHIDRFVTAIVNGVRSHHRVGQ